MGLPFPLPACCRGLGSGRGSPRCAAAVLGEFGLSRIAALFGHDGWEPRSATGEAVTVGGFDDAAGSDHCGEAFVESGGADATGCAQCRERAGLLAVGEGCCDALIDGSWFDTMLSTEPVDETVDNSAHQERIDPPQQRYVRLCPFLVYAIELKLPKF
jgi:hypothetical protein